MSALPYSGRVRAAAQYVAMGHQLTLTRHFGLTKLTPSLQIDLTKIHCVHLRYSILARHQIAAEPACRFLQPRARAPGRLYAPPRHYGKRDQYFVVRKAWL